MRTKEGIDREINDYLIAIKIEEKHLKLNTSLGTWHHPKQRIALYKKELQKLSKYGKPME